MTFTCSKCGTEKDRPPAINTETFISYNAESVPGEIPRTFDEGLINAKFCSDCVADVLPNPSVSVELVSESGLEDVEGVGIND